jgi:hypothetical protein
VILIVRNYRRRHEIPAFVDHDGRLSNRLLSDSWVERSFDQLPFFSDDAKRFYLPAFLRVGALKPNSLVAQFLLYALSDEFRMHPSGGYSQQQKQAIRDYLQYAGQGLEDLDREYLEAAKALWQAGT